MRFPCVLSALAAASALLFAPAAHAASPGNDAVAYQINPAHTGAVYTPNLTPPFHKAWSVDLGGSVSYPLIAQGKVYVTVDANNGAAVNLYALDATTGSVVWGPVNVVGTGLYFAPTGFANAAYDAGRVFTVGAGGTMAAYDADTGTPVWTTQLPDQYSFSSAPTAANGIVYTGGAGDGGTLYAVRESDGTLLWTQGVENGDSSSPAVTQDGVYVSYVGPQSYKFDPITGSLLWHYQGYGEGGGGSTPVLYNDSLFVRQVDNGQNSGQILSAADGAVLGTFAPGYFVNPAIPAFDNGSAFLRVGGSLTASDLAFQSSRWTFAPTNDTVTAAALVVNGVVITGTNAGNLYALNEATGQTIWSDAVGAPIPAPPAFEGSGQPLTGLSAGDSLLVVPAGHLLVAYAGTTPATPPAATVTSFTLDPGSQSRTVVGGRSLTATVTLNVAAPAGGLSVPLASSLPGLASVPAQVQVAAGDSSATVPISTTSPVQPQTALLSASLGGVTETASVTVLTAPAVARVLWNNPDGRVLLWAVDAQGGHTTVGTYGPYSDSGGVWKAKAVATGPNGVTRILWTNPDGRVTLWYVNPDGSYGLSGVYGPYTDSGGVWSAKALSVGPDNVAHILWNNPDGRATLWFVNPDQSYGLVGAYGPYADGGGLWSAKSLATGPNGVSRIVWGNPDGRATLWYVNPDASYGVTGAYGPYADAGGLWTAGAVSVGPDDAAHILWNNPDGRATLWFVNPDASYGLVGAYGPYADSGGTWSASALATGADGVSRILWGNPDGRTTLWYVNPDASYGLTGAFPAFSDDAAGGGLWSAGAVSAGP